MKGKDYWLLWSFWVLLLYILPATIISTSQNDEESVEEELLKPIPVTLTTEEKKNTSTPGLYRGEQLQRSNRTTTNNGSKLNQTLESNEETGLIAVLGKENNRTVPQFLENIPTTPPGEFRCRPSKLDTCSNRCSNQTHFFLSHINTVSRCNCDPACNDVFMDCCSDYTKLCEANTRARADPVYLTRSYWKCETQLKVQTTPCERPPGIWMISRCPTDWPDDVIHQKCHEPPMELNNQFLESFVPVFNAFNKFTYRNQYCALCHNVTQYAFWNLDFGLNTILPLDYNLTNLRKFIEKNSKFFTSFIPKDRQPLRYCYFPTVIKTCPEKFHSEVAGCMNGPFEIVHSNDSVYKNRACASCNKAEPGCPPGPMFCSFLISRISVSISQIVDLQNYGGSLVTTACPQNQVFDPYMGACRVVYAQAIQKSLKDSFRVILFLSNFSSTLVIPKMFIHDDLVRNFNVSRSQIANVQQFHKFSEIIITFTLHLTPIQSLMHASDSQELRSSNETLGLQRLLRFQKPFQLRLSGGIEFTVFRVNLRQLACIHRRVYRFGEYVVLHDRRVYVNSTGATYKQNEYELNTTNARPNATVCLKVVPLNMLCNGSYIKLNSSEYQFLPNLTMVYRTSKYDFGNYTYENGTVFICVTFQRTHQVILRKRPQRDIALTILTLAGFVLSIICLFALIVTYSLFKELRTLPGRNLRSLAASLALAEFLWLCGPGFAENHIVCTGVAIANHYFFLVFFTASSVNAFHFGLVFARSDSSRRSKGKDKKRFLLYSILTWGIPALFVATCFLLDLNDLFLIGYGSSGICWLGTNRSKLFLFVVPLGALLLFNLSLFAIIAICLFLNRKWNSRVVANNDLKGRHKENILICLKLSTLMGFSWLLIFLHIIVRAETDAFLYLFVIFVSLQGVFISVAFLFNRKCVELYRGLLWTKCASNRSNSQNNVRRGNCCARDT